MSAALKSRGYRLEATHLTAPDRVQRLIGLLLNPAEERFESLFAVGHFSGDGGFFFVAKQRNIEGHLAPVNANGGAGKRSRFRMIGSGHCEIQTGGYRL
ncbi:hypothetical protein GGP78_001992 [Salinibacter ruber]|uniref:hypothetical protein n=1 Tax=Salinibacter ruber TaxID=146919 RepID=UPI00216A5947|nr:hypothetical protein [Salinibacter ruber]MCS3855300.1 hypothetical protein [Salinibacter ruber]